jgi:predicted membrane protein
MACYNREFLVPYLNNLCALELARVKTRELLNQANGEIARLNQAVDSIQIRPMEDTPRLSMSVEPEKTQAEAHKHAMWALVFVVAFLVSFYIFISDGDRNYTSTFEGINAWVVVLSPIGVAVNLVYMIGFKIQLHGEVKTANKQKRAHEEAVSAQKRSYNAYVSKTAAAKSQAIAERDRRLPALSSDAKLYETKIGELNALIDRAYRANVVPTPYRNVYAAWYLSEYFSSSGANDVDVVLQTFVLEQIKERLDRIIEQQQQIIFNQQRAYAEQVAARMGQERFRSEMIDRLDRIGASGEERERYLSMIDSNVRATFWMSVAGYLKK